MNATCKRHRILAGLLALTVIVFAAAAPLAAAEWKVETVDQSGPGRFTSLKIDRNGNAHLIYVPEADDHPLKYAFWDHTRDQWFTMKVAKYASFCTLTLDSKQRPHISYADHGTGKGAKLRYVYWDGAEWKTQAVSPPGDAVVAYYTSIALDANDKPNFAYYDYDGPPGVGFLLRMRSVFWNGKFWEVRMVDPQQGSGKFNSMAVDSAGHPQLAYANVKAESSGLRYASWNGTAWKTEIIEGAEGPTPILSVAMILDSNDTPHIAYTNAERRIVKYATRRNGMWTTQVVASVDREGYPDRNGIAVDNQGNPYISYYDAGQGSLKLAFRKDNKWYGELLANEYAGFTSSLQIHDGVLWMAYEDDTGMSVKVARRRLDAAGAGPSPPAMGAATKSAMK